jgi:hypothetical protein
LVEPVFMKIWAGSVIERGVFIELMMAMSSTTSAKCGSASDNSAPHRPYLANLNRVANRAASGLMNA